MTEREIQAEKRHIYETRLGILGVLPTDKPTPIQIKIAQDEADQWEERIRFESAMKWAEKQKEKGI